MGKKEFRGVFNRYRKGMPTSEIVLKDLGFWVKKTLLFFNNGFKKEQIHIFPHYPSRGSTIYKVAQALNLNISNKRLYKIKCAVYWEYLTNRVEYKPLEELEKSGVKVVNLYSRDISKIYVDKIHQKVFGYCTVVDPLNFEGEVVIKSDTNALHDGRIVKGPISKIDEGNIYQILIDNKHTDDLVLDYRVPIVNTTLDFVYLKYRDISERFKNTTVNTVVEDINNYFSNEEIDLINRFCSAMKLEYGELDVLRNKNDGKIYIVDVNNTPQGPPANTPKKDGELAIKKIAAQFKSEFLAD